MKIKLFALLLILLTVGQKAKRVSQANGAQKLEKNCRETRIQD